MQQLYIPAKLLIGFVGRYKGEPYVSVTKEAGARGGTIVFGRSFGDNKLLQALCLADISQDIVFTLMGNEADAVVSALQAFAKEQPKKFAGFVVMLDVSGMSVRVLNPVTADNSSEKSATTLPSKEALRSNNMESGYTLISVIVNTGYADDVMAVARNAGAQGGTILNARGTGTEEDVKFFGITLVPEKEMLMIVADQDKVQAIVTAIGTVSTLNEPGGGIVYTMPVEQFFVLGKD